MAELVFGLSCFSIDILWKNLSCPELLLSSFLCLSYVCCCCSCCSGWCGHYPVLCMCLCEWLSDCARVSMRNNWNSTTVIVCLCLIKNYRWIRSDLSKKHSSVALMVLLCRFFTVAMETKILQYRLFEKTKTKIGERYDLSLAVCVKKKLGSHAFCMRNNCLF